MAPVPPHPRRILEHWAERSGGSTAVAGADHLTYGDLFRGAQQMRDLLAAAGCRAGTRVGLSLPNSADFVVSLFGILHAGATAVPVDPRLPVAEAGQLLETASCTMWITAAGVETDAACWTESGRTAACVIHRARTPRSAVEDTGSAALLLHFSSGSSSEPKRIPRRDEQIFEDYRHFGEALDLGSGDRYLALAPFYHAYGALGLWAALAFGGCVLPVRRFMPATVLQQTTAFAPTFTLLTPQMIDALARCGLKDGQASAFASARHVISSTAPLGAETHQKFLDRYGVPPKIQYGSTETLSATLVRDGGFAPGRAGTPYPGVEIAIFDDDGRRLAPGSAGHVGIRSAANCDGFEGRPAGDIRRFGDFVLPGDVGFIDAKGELFLAGREDIVNIGGYKVSPTEVMSLLAASFRIGYMKLLAYSRAGVPSLRAIIESDDPAITAGAVADLCRQHLAPYKVPSRIDIIERLPRDENGKVTMKLLQSILDDI